MSRTAFRLSTNEECRSSGRDRSLDYEIFRLVVNLRIHNTVSGICGTLRIQVVESPADDLFTIRVAT
jgi:hypothetical protein